MQRALKILSAALIALMPLSAIADDGKNNDDPFELTIDENTTPPKLGKKQTEALRQRMQTIVSDLRRHKYNVTKSHNGLVVTVSIPCSRLFAANDTTKLLPDAENLLKPLLPYAEKTDLYKIVISVHSDNTGSEQYRYDVTEARANLLCDFFEKHAPETEKAQTVIPYGLGHEEKLNADDSILNRSRNRRAEINIVPLK
ncbi:MAG: hypothetical protein K2G24_03770 [Muribaculaceae bacterium]|nr:hypothetical protein [Muribaculaceae bacterium]